LRDRSNQWLGLRFTRFALQVSPSRIRRLRVGEARSVRSSLALPENVGLDGQNCARVVAEVLGDFMHRSA